MAGGRGTRISSVASDIPKPMIQIGGKPVLEHLLECLKMQGFHDIIITVGHLGYVIIDYFGDGRKISPVTKEPFGVNIEYYVEEEPLGNAGALFNLREKLTKDFLLLNADVMMNVDFKRLVAAHKNNGGLATILTHPNDHPYDSGLVIADENGRVIKWLAKEDERPQWYKNKVNAGIHVLSSELLNKEVETAKVDLDRQILKPLVQLGELYAYDSPEYVKDMGTPERYESVCEDYKSGRIVAKNLKQKQKAIFLDRDGVINKYVGFLRSIDEFELIEDVVRAINKINKSDYLAIVVTNQPVIARGEVTVEKLHVIHNKMETLLGNQGAYLDAVYYCPHHPHKGYEGEVPQLKIECNCRKPKPGMLLKAAEDFNIDLSQSWMVGDSENDILAGKNAGCKTVLIGKGDSDFFQDKNALSLWEFISEFLE